jgi:16S rRNA (guanine527-N7)-methyltransferase
VNPGILEPLIAASGELGVVLTPRAMERFETYHALLLVWNRRINLISRKDTGRIVGYHFVDSLRANPLIPANSSVCDLGSGAGLPGIPCAIVRDDIRLVLVESIRKKAIFLEQVVKQLDLENTVVLSVRGEEIKDRSFDVVLCRLLGKTADVARRARGLLAPQGRIILYKSEAVAAELKQAQPVLDRLHLRVAEIRDYRARGPEEFVRRLVVLQP